MQQNLLSRLPRCEKPDLFELDMYLVQQGDTAKVRREKWAGRAMHIYMTPCANQARFSFDCPRCTESFLRAVDRPEGPWAA